MDAERAVAAPVEKIIFNRLLQNLGVRCAAVGTASDSAQRC